MTSPSEQLEEITAMIAKARDSLSYGTSIDMQEIQGLVQEVCDSIQQNPPADEVGVHDKIVSTISNLNLLMEELKIHQNQVEDEAIKKGSKNNEDEA
jgi:hypothetical protein